MENVLILKREIFFFFSWTLFPLKRSKKVLSGALWLLLLFISCPRPLRSSAGPNLLFWKLLNTVGMRFGSDDKRKLERTNEEELLSLLNGWKIGNFYIKTKFDLDASKDAEIRDAIFANFEEENYTRNVKSAASSWKVNSLSILSGGESTF